MGPVKFQAKYREVWQLIWDQMLMYTDSSFYIRFILLDNDHI